MAATDEMQRLKSPTQGRFEKAAKQRRRGIRWLVISVVWAAGMFALWWLVATTNREGHHDAEYLPIFTLIPLTLAAYHFWRARRLNR